MSASSLCSLKLSSSISFIASSSSVARTLRGPPQPASADFLGGVLPSSQSSRSLVTVASPSKGMSVAEWFDVHRSEASKGSTMSSAIGGGTKAGLGASWAAWTGSSGRGGSTGWVMSLR